MNKVLTVAALAAFVSLAPSSAQAATVPVGVQNNVNAATVSGWGFTECFSATYGTLGLTTTGMLSGCQGDTLMLAARRTGSSVFEVLGAASYADVTYNTGTGNVTHSANGIEWYFSNNYSWGFAAGGDTVSRSSCDTNSTNAAQRLCWHTHQGYSGGWRAGSFTGLNSSPDWEKVILVGNAANNIPEPASLGLVGVALLGLAAGRKRKSA